MSSPQSKITNKFLTDLLKRTQKELLDPSKHEEVNLNDIWALVVGEKMAALTEIKSFNQGILTIKVASASLSHLLSTTEKPKILSKLKSGYPFLKIKNLVFRSG